jgi:dihydrofolate reductase
MRCSVYIATSLDGCIASKDGRLDWLSLVECPGEDYGYARFLASVDTLVVGRKTYDTARGFPAWPYAGKRCVVLTSGVPESAPHGEEFYAGDPVALVSRLAREGAKHVYVDGGAAIRALLAAGLVTEITISIVPTVLGEGVPLFAGLAEEVRLELVESKSFSSGLVQMTYRPRPRPT